MSFSNICAIEQHQPVPPYTSEEIRQVVDFAHKNGLKIFPLSNKDDCKSPCCKGWLSAATYDPEKLQQLFETYKKTACRFGVPCKINNLIIIDCDVKEVEKWGNGIEQFHAYCEKHDLPLSPVWQSTPSGGRHYLYKGDFPEVIRSRTKIWLDGVRVNIDIRSPSAPESNGTYIVSDLSGRSGYAWHGDCSQIPPLPQHLVEELKEKPYNKALQSASEDWDEIIEREVPAHIVKIVENRLAKIAATPEGDRNNTVFKLSCNICRWLLPFPGEWEKWEPRILEAALKTELAPKEARKAIEQGRKGAEADGPYPPERYQVEEQHNGDLVELPKEAFSKTLWLLITSIANLCKTSKEVALASILTLAAQCLGYNRSIEIDDQTIQRSNLWIVLISAPGSGKSTCFDIVTQRLREIQSELRAERQKEEEEWKKWQLLSKNEKAERLEKGEKEPMFPPPVALIARDTTLEALCECFETHPRSIIYYADEMRGFFGSHKRYHANNVGSANSDPLLAMFDSRPVDILRKTKDRIINHIVLERATLTLLGNIQPGLIKELFSSEDFEQGWPQRCIFICAPDPKPLIYPHKKSICNIHIDSIIRKLTDRLWKAGKKLSSTRIDRECEQYLGPYSESLAYDFKEPPLSKLQSFSRRFYWISFRIIHVLFFLEWALTSELEEPEKLTPWHAYKGVQLCRWLITNTVTTFLNEKNREESGQTLQKTIAKIIIDHEKEIVAEEYKVPNSVFRDWLNEAGLAGRADQFFTKTLTSMQIIAGKARKIQNGENKPVNVKTFSDEALKLCRKLVKPALLLFARLNELDPPSGTEPGTWIMDSAIPLPPAISISVPQPDMDSLPQSKIEVKSSEAVDASPLITDYSNPHGFTHLHLHTDRSFQDAILTIDEAVEQAKKCNMTSLAITDHGNLHNAWKFYHTAQAWGIHPVLGCEIYLKNDGLFPAPPDGEKKKAWFHLTLLAETQEGWKNLLVLQKHSFDNLFCKKPLVSHDFLASHSRGLIGMSACLGGEIAQAILQNHDPKPILEWYQKTFGETSFFLERMENGYPELQIVNPMLRTLSQECGVPIVATSDVHYLTPEDREAYLVNSMQDFQLNTGVSIAERGRELWSLHFRTAEEIRAAHENKIEELALAGKIAARCNVELLEPEKSKHFLPSSATIVGSEKESAEVLREKAFAGLVAIGMGDKQEYVERLEYELKIITQKGFENYILIIADMVEEAKRKDILVGPGRGSGAGSLVCYALRITQVDPIQNDLLFERFINPDRLSLPDIDIDYDEERRGVMVDYIRAKYREKFMAAIGTVSTRKGKEAINDVVRNLQNDRPVGMSKKDWRVLGEKLSSCVPNNCKKTISELEDAGIFATVTDPVASLILKLAARLEGLGREAGQHASGYIISSHPLETAIPLRRTDKDGPIVTQRTKDEIEAAGYVKLDILSSLTLTRIRKTIEKIRASGKPEPSFSLDDHKTFDLFKSGHTIGIFQISSDGMRRLVRKINPKSLQDLAVAIALFRPGPLNSDNVDHFLKRRNGKEKISYFGMDEELRPILKETYGVIVYQEQVMRIAQAVAGFTAAEADTLRAAMSKKKMDLMVEKKALFMDGAAQKGVSEEKAAELFSVMEKFAEYGFNKSHAVAYALISWQTAYLKANYPAEFLAACCETKDANITPRSIAVECTRLGLDKKDLPTKYDLTGFSEHPLKAYGDKEEGVTNVSDVAKGQRVSIRVYAEKVRETVVKKGYSSGRKMGMGKVSDETGFLNFVSFPEAWGAGKIKKGKCYIMTGDIKLNKDKDLQIEVKKVKELGPKAK